MSGDDGFAHQVDYLLLIHERRRPLHDCATCQHGTPPKHRKHLAELICSERAEADEKRARPPRDFAELLAAHAPYNNPAQGLVIQCPTCVDGCGGGVFKSTAEWARHFQIELARAGMRITKAAR